MIFKRLTFIIIAAICTGFCIQAQETKKITLEDIFQKSTFRAESVSGLRPMKDGEHYTTLENGSRIIQNPYKNGEETSVIFDITKIEDAPISSFSGYTFSQDETKILLMTQRKKIYRRSFTAIYYVWNRLTSELTPLSEKGPQQVATFSPDGEKVAFVRENNLFIKNLKFGSESQITKDGARNKIINGVPDWVYEEEFGFNKAFWWAPDSEFLAYIRFDETDVPEYSLTMYAGKNPKLEENMPYPAEKTFKYPKAGDKNAKVSVKSYELYSRKTIDVDLGDMPDFYVPRLKWTPDGEDLVVLRMNRRQNQLDVLYANPYTGDTRPILTEKNDRYISEDFLDAFTYLDNGRFVITSERDGWSHLYLYDRLGFEQGQLTQGEFDVTQFYGYDQEEGLFYYQAAAKSPLRREVYYTNKNGTEKGSLSSLQGTNSAVFSKNYTYYINYYSSNDDPGLVTVHENITKKGIPVLREKERNTELIRVLQDNTLLKKRMENYTIPLKEFFSFTTSEGIRLNGYMIRPAGFDENKQYPVLINQYSGPNSQTVRDSWGGVGWTHYLAQEGFIIVSVDPRGTGARGEDFRKVTYRQLGKYESDDMVETAKYLGSLPYVDAGNTGIFGWSYGGCMTLLSMEKGGNLFKAGISVAPVTNWRFYDTIYTERYMTTPSENPEGYDENSPLTHAGDMKGRLLIVHGSADDNVHPQNTYEFTERLVQEGIQFDMAIYTNRAHGISGGNTTIHLYTKMIRFLKDHLQ